MKDKFIKGAAILSISNIIVKILGLVYRIPLANILTDVGIGYLTMSIDVYSVLLGISTSGVNVAIAKLVSERLAENDYYGAKKVFRIALIMLTVAGTVSSILLLLGAFEISELIGDINSYYAIKALVPALFFVPIMSSFRGYFQGHNNMGPTALSQIVEQLFKIVFAIILSSMLLNEGLDIAAGGASMGSSIGAMIATILIIVIYINHTRKNKYKYYKGLKIESNTKIIKEILRISIPLSLGVIVIPIVAFLDKIIIIRRLSDLNISSKISAAIIGQISLAQTVVNFPLLFSVSLGISLVPVISGLIKKNNTKTLNKTIKSSIFLTILIGLPASFGILSLATPIIEMLYSKGVDDISVAGNILGILSISVIFLMIMQSLTAVLQGIGKVNLPIRNIIIGGIIKLVLTYLLMGIEHIALYGSAISTVVFYLIASLLDFIAVKKYTSIEIDKMKFIIKPFIASIIMFLIVISAKYIILSSLNNILSIIIAIIIGVFIYFVLIFKFVGIEEKYLRILPNSDRIIKILKKIKFLY